MTETPEDSELQTPLPDQEVDVAPDADEPGDEMPADMKDLVTDSSEVVPDETDGPDADGVEPESVA